MGIYDAALVAVKEVAQRGATIETLQAELAASESLVTALQEQMARLAEQHAKAVADLKADFDEADGHIAECQRWLYENGAEAGGDGSLLHGMGRLLERAEAAESALAAEVERHQATAKRAAMLRDLLMKAQPYIDFDTVDADFGEGFNAVWLETYDERTGTALASLPAGPREDR